MNGCRFHQVYKMASMELVGMIEEWRDYSSEHKQDSSWHWHSYSNHASQMLDNHWMRVEVFHLENALRKTYVDVDDREVEMMNHQDWSKSMRRMKSTCYTRKNPHRNSTGSNDLETSLLACLCMSTVVRMHNLSLVTNDGMVDHIFLLSFSIFSLSLARSPFLLYARCRWLTPVIGLETKYVSI